MSRRKEKPDATKFILEWQRNNKGWSKIIYLNNK